MVKLKTITEERKKTSVDIPVEIYGKIEVIGERKDRKNSWVINYLLKMALDTLEERGL